MAANGDTNEDISSGGSDTVLPAITCELGILTQPHGSALVTQGHTAVVAAVYGPREVRMQRLRVDRADVEAVFRPKAGVPCTADKMREALIRQTCETAMHSALYPRTTIMLILQELEDNGGFLACAINASCLALMNSGVSMKFLYAAVSCSILPDETIVLDQDNTKVKDAVGHMTFAFDSINKNVIASYTGGNFSQNKYMEGLSLCRDASNFLFELYRDIVRKYACTL
ncbi:hypothetical protein B566_EDAN008683 [Ephemera danica]|nr:hypothetical protein B566_EDAN008683 [Ephemera danica]